MIAGPSRCRGVDTSGNGRRIRNACRCIEAGDPSRQADRTASQTTWRDEGLSGRKCARSHKRGDGPRARATVSEHVKLCAAINASWDADTRAMAPCMIASELRESSRMAVRPRSSFLRSAAGIDPCKKARRWQNSCQKRCPAGCPWHHCAQSYTRRTKRLIEVIR